MPDTQPQPGLELDMDILVQTQNNYISQAAIKSVQMETAVQQLMNENMDLRNRLAVYDDVESTKAEEG
jgi:hypothetical protein